jgi:hypothetical protein
MRTAASALAALVVLLAAVGRAVAAYDFSQHPTLLTLGTCASAQPGTNTPLVDRARTRMSRNEISFAAYTVPVIGRKMTMYLGTNATDPTCFGEVIGDTDNCRYDYMLAGNWTGLRGCGWSSPDMVSRKGFEVRNNTVCELAEDPVRGSLSCGWLVDSRVYRARMAGYLLERPAPCV